MRLLPYLLAASLLAGCAQSPTKEETKEENTQRSSTNPAIGPVISSTQSVKPERPPVLYLCLSSRPSQWPVDNIINTWNVNGKNLFVVVPSTSNIKCRETINLVLVSGVNYEGETEFFKDYIEVRLNKNSIVKTHTLCHELGHVLGLPHNQDPDSCMNIGKTVQSPSTKDIENVGAQYWIKEESARHAAGQ
jgi:hypothetical protein